MSWSPGLKTQWAWDQGGPPQTSPGGLVHLKQITLINEVQIGAKLCALGYLPVLRSEKSIIVNWMGVIDASVLKITTFHLTNIYNTEHLVKGNQHLGYPMAVTSTTF